MSQKEVFAWLNADDRWLVLEAVRKAVSYLKDHLEVDAVYGAFVMISEDG